MSRLFKEGIIGKINKETLEIYFTDKNVILALLYNPKKMYKEEHIEEGYKVNVLYDTKTKEIKRLDVLNK